MKVRTWFQRMQTALTMSPHMTKGQLNNTQENLDQLFELFRPYLEDDMAVAIEDIKRT